MSLRAEGALRTRRVELDLTLREIAERLGVTSMRVSQIEKDDLIPLDDPRAKRLADAYELSAREVRDLAVSARAKRGAVELPTRATDPERQELAVSLARSWLDLSHEKIAQLRTIVGSDEED